jgi:hypothetical protein
MDHVTNFSYCRRINIMIQNDFIISMFFYMCYSRSYQEQAEIHILNVE